MFPMMGNRLGKVLRGEAKISWRLNENGPGKEDRKWGQFTGENVRNFYGSSITAVENPIMNPLVARRRKWQEDY
jgi:hypothetical protein